jgi:hypothetical protein
VSLEDDRGDRLLEDLREPILEWLDERQLEAARIHAPETDVVLTRG